ncbi:MAG: Sua5/YciO/YrdC/YwlC family protein [Bifidobacteriaceae bacterium]|nr:Sua5/YciO/YrdC/YwlC family protein [Bifidobacteriaceae bacterium]
MKNVLIIGKFDTVHKGHQELIKFAKSVTKSEDINLIAIQLLKKDPIIPEECTENKLLNFGVNEIHQYSLEKHLSSIKKYKDLTYKEFIDLLNSKYQIDTIVLGPDQKIGKNQEGDYHNINQYASSINIQTYQLNTKLECSSTQIKNNLNDDIFSAYKLSGSLHCIKGIVTHGHQRGRKLGFPTANILATTQTTKGFVPAEGVYAGIVTLKENESYLSMISIGNNPTFEDVPNMLIEANLLDVDDINLYDQEIKISFISKIADSKKFNSVDELTEKIKHYQTITPEYYQKYLNYVMQENAKSDLILIKTDTVWGISTPINNAISGDDQESFQNSINATCRIQNNISKIFDIKKRSQDKPLPILINDYSELESLGVVPKTIQQILNYQENNNPEISKTYIIRLDSDPKIPIFTAPNSQPLKTGDTVAVRKPNDHILNSLLKISGPLLTTSLNESGQNPVLTANDAIIFKNEHNLEANIMYEYLDLTELNQPQKPQQQNQNQNNQQNQPTNKPSPLIDLTNADNLILR